MFNFLHNNLPNPILLNLNFIKIHWYGFLITLGAVVCFFVFYKLALKKGLNKKKIFDLIFWTAIWSIIGARLYHVFSEINYYLSNPLQIFAVWNGGVGIYGAIIAGLIVIYFFSKKHQIKFLTLLDCFAPGLALAQFIGRWGNYFNQELYGWPSDLPWSIPVAFKNRLPAVENFSHFHPTFLYESLFCLILGVVLFILINKKIKPGLIFFLYIILYSTQRFFIEFLRIDYQPVFLNLRLGQWTSLVFVLISMFFIFYAIIKKK